METRVEKCKLEAREDLARSGVFYALGVMVFLLQELVQWPLAWDFKQFLLYDPGSALKADWLVGLGLKPGVEFAYSYGLLSLDVGHWWFGWMGRTPFGYTSLTLCLSVLLVLGIVHAGLAMRLRTASMVLLLVLLPYAVYPFYLNQTHALEAVLLIWGIGLQARGRLGTALALATVCLFVKPSMGYVYGLVLTVQILVGVWRDGLRSRESVVTPGGAGGWGRVGLLLRGFGPAAGVMMVLVSYCILRWGMGSFAATFLPANARASYLAAGFGFFKTGREFWIPTVKQMTDQHRPASLALYYLSSEAGFWLLALGATAGFLLVWGAGAMRRRRIGTQDVALLTVIFLHVVFVLMLYAWSRSWIYYGYMPMLGIAGVVDRVGMRRRWLAVTVLGVVAMLGMSSRWTEATWAWVNKKALPQTVGLRAYVTADYNQVAEWEGIHLLLRDTNGLFLANGFAGGLYGDVRTPRTWFLSPGLQTAAEWADIRKQIKESNVVVRFRELEQQGLDPWNEAALKDVTGAFKEEGRSSDYIVMRRKE